MKTVIIVFAFVRPLHIRKLLISLSKNKESSSIPIVFFIDGPRSKKDLIAIEEVKNEILTYSDYFNSLKIIQRKNNLGCRENILQGVSQCFEKYQSAIILEDDLIVDKFFLKYMMDSLKRYASNEKVFHISGYSFLNINSKKAVFSRFMNCWGWATWKNRWELINTNAESIAKNFSNNDIFKFNMDGSHDFFRQIIENRVGISKTWAIFWYASIFENNGLCLTPLTSLVRNVGNDGTGERCGKELVNSKLNNILISDYPFITEEDKDVFNLLKKYFESRNNKLKSFIIFIIYLLPFSLQKPLLTFLLKLRIKLVKFRKYRLSF